MAHGTSAMHLQFLFFHRIFEWKHVNWIFYSTCGGSDCPARKNHQLPCVSVCLQLAGQIKTFPFHFHPWISSFHFKVANGVQIVPKNYVNLLELITSNGHVYAVPVCVTCCLQFQHTRRFFSVRSVHISFIIIRRRRRRRRRCRRHHIIPTLLRSYVCVRRAAWR